MLSESVSKVVAMLGGMIAEKTYMEPNQNHLSMRVRDEVAILR